MGAFVSQDTIHRQAVDLNAAAKYSGLGVRTLQRYIRSGRLTAYKLGPHKVRIYTDDLDALMQPVGGQAVDRLAEHAARVVSTWPPPTEAQLARIAAILRAGGA